jgi:hypothetical protein
MFMGLTRLLAIAAHIAQHRGVTKRFSALWAGFGPDFCIM